LLKQRKWKGLIEGNRNVVKIYYKYQIPTVRRLLILQPMIVEQPKKDQRTLICVLLNPRPNWVSPWPG